MDFWEMLTLNQALKSGGGKQPAVIPLNVTDNGTYRAPSGKAYNPVNVNVQGSSVVVQPLSVTENGTYNPPSGVDGFAPVTVNVSGGGDDPFSLVNYIASSGTQWIDTGYFIKANTKVEVVCHVESVSRYAAMFGNDSESSNGQFMYARSYSGNSFTDFYGNTYSNLGSGSTLMNRKITITKDYGTGSAIKASSWPCAYVIHSGTYSANDAALCIFALKTSGEVNSFASMRLYRFRIYEGDSLVHEYVPWQDANDIVCLKDTVTDALLYNQGTGDFVYGTDE